MTLRHLKIFIALIENNFNTSKTAEKLLMTQPAVSIAIKELEQYYGITLFDRINHRLKITEAGNRFKEYASHILTLFDDMEKSMKNWDSIGLIRIGSSITIGSQFLPNYVKEFYNIYPNTNVKVQIGPSDQLEKKILNNELDFALIEGVVHNHDFISEEYMEDCLTVICSPNGPFKQSQEISIEEFKKQNILLREHGSGTRETIENVIEAAGFSIEPTWEAMSTTALVNAVINGLGISILPHRMIVGPLEKGLVIAINIKGLEFKRKFQIIYHKNKMLTSSAKFFINLCKNYEIDYPLPNYNGLY
ncbi:LysR family transcriptional regulator [Merdibacter massiliensis]|uniref:LysR family transcriptional regulator n=1 Tax=Merdibacter massiliensis TaxID=1871030 RepID=UPI00096A3F16|nr:LysR family transcriptional regulator [Merdibacter massiliensis]